MMRLTILLLLLPVFVWAQTIPSDVVVIDEYTPLPDNMRDMGNVTTLDAPNKRGCMMDEKILEAKYETFRLKGNVFKINKIINPFTGTCYRIKGKAYYADNPEAIRKQIESIPDTTTRQLISDTARYALLYFYRPHGSFNTPFRRKLLIDDTEACRGEKGNKCIRMVEVEGDIYIHSDVFPAGQLRLNVKYGHVYFIRCEVVDDLIMTVQKPNYGYKEFKRVKEFRP